MKKFFAACLMLMFLAVMVGTVWAAEDDGTEEKEKRFLFMGNLKAWGINGAVGYRLPEILEERDSILWLMLGTRIEHRGYYRTVDDEFYHGSAHDYDDFTYWAGHLNWAVGFSQALINDDRKDTDLLYISLYFWVFIIFGNTI
ncbi:MAG: hypothetical protein MJ215_07545 [Spirochaetia bacterium]|nr:hypothetical protein [Spirochaetia bacterium]